MFEGRKGDAGVTALAFHQCGLDLNPGVDALCGLSLLLLLSLAPRGFSPATPVFLSPQNQHFQIPIRNQLGEEPLSRCATSKIVIYLFIYLFIYLYVNV